MQLQRLPRVVSISVSSPGYPYLPYLPGESQGGDAQSSSPIESSRGCADFKFEFAYFSSTDFSPASTCIIIFKVIIVWRVPPVAERYAHISHNLIANSRAAPLRAPISITPLSRARFDYLLLLIIQMADGQFRRTNLFFFFFL